MNNRNRPVAKESKPIEQGRLNAVDSYLEYNDPAAYYYQKFKNNNNKYLRDDYWAEAATRGELDYLVQYLEDTEKEDYKNDMYDIMDGYGGRMEYDDYMLALSYDRLDDEKKEPRTDKTTFDEDGNMVHEGTDNEYGEFTDKEWAKSILEYKIGLWDAQIIDEMKATRRWLSGLTKISAYTGNIVWVGLPRFLGDIYNFGEGLLNLAINWSDEDKVGSRFLYAFDDEQSSNPLGNLSEFMSKVSFELQRRFSNSVSAERAYQEGYTFGEDENFIQRINDAQGQGAGYTTWGRRMNAMTEGIGYMLPTIGLSLLTGGASSGAAGAAQTVSVGSKVLSTIVKARSLIFYTGIFSGMVKESIAGQNYKDLNAGKVVGHAATKALLQWGIEKALGAIIGFSGLDELLGAGKSASRIGAKAAANAAVKGGAKAFGRFALNTGFGAFKEGLEETLQDLSDLVLDSAYSGKFGEHFEENFSMQNFMDAFIVGAMTSVVMGSVADIGISINNPHFGIDEDNKPFKMGIFQNMAFNEAMAKANEWRETMNDEKASINKRAKAALAFDTSMSIIGNVYKEMGVERAIKADNLIKDMQQTKEKQTKLAKMKTAAEYSNELINDFQEMQGVLGPSYRINKELEKEAKKAIKENAEQMKEANVTAAESAVTTETIANDPNNKIEEDAVIRLKDLLDKSGAKMILGVNGNVVIRSEEAKDVIIADNSLVMAGDVEGIIRRLAYDQVRKTVKTYLTQNLKDHIVKSYKTITGIQPTIDEAINALLFDRNFYTYVLLLAAEGGKFQNVAFKILATIDKVLETRFSPQVKAGRVDDKAFTALLEKVRGTMRDGLVTFATQYAIIDLGDVSAKIITPEMRNAILNHRNVRFTEMVNDGIKSEPDQKHIEAYAEAIDKLGLDQNLARRAKIKAASKNHNDRIDAYIFLVFQNRIARNIEDKLIYLPTNPNNTLDKKYIKEVAKSFGTSWSKLIDGTYDKNKVPAETQAFIDLQGRDMNNKRDRFAVIRTILFKKSANTLTLGINGEVIKVLDKETFVKKRYSGRNGNANLSIDIRKRQVRTLQDISSKALDPRIGGLRIVYDHKLLSSRGSYVDGTDFIAVNPNLKNELIDVIMHEATHATQYILGVGSEVIIGADSSMFGALPETTKSSIMHYIKDNFDLSNETLTNHTVNGQNLDEPTIIYFMLAGELQANATLSSIMFDIGFTWKRVGNDMRGTLVSPDGKMEWSMKTESKPNVAAVKSQKTKRKSKDEELDNRYTKLNTVVSNELKKLYGDRVKVDVDGRPYVDAERRGNMAVLYHGTYEPKFNQELYQKYMDQDDAEFLLYTSTVPEYAFEYGTHVYEILIPYDDYKKLDNDEHLDDFREGTNYEVWQTTQNAFQRTLTSENKKLTVNEIDVNGLLEKFNNQTFRNLQDRDGDDFNWEQALNRTQAEPKIEPNGATLAIGDIIKKNVTINGKLETVNAEVVAIEKQGKGSMTSLKIPTGQILKSMIYDGTPLSKVAQAKKTIVAQLTEDNDSKDVPLSEQERFELANEQETKTFMKDAYLVEDDGKPILIYRGNGRNNFLSEDLSFFTTSAWLAAHIMPKKDNTENKSGLRAYITNLKESDFLVIDNEGKDHLKVKNPITGKLENVNEVVKDPEITKKYKGMIILNITEEHLEDPVNDVVIFNTGYNNIRWVSKEDDGKFSKAWNKRKYTLMRALYLNKFLENRLPYNMLTDDFNEFVKEYKEKNAHKKIKNAKLPLNMDKPLSQTELNELTERPDIKEFMKDAYLVDKDGRPVIYYRGAMGRDGKGNLIHPNHMFMSTSAFISYYYAGWDRATEGTHAGYVINLKKEDVYVFNAKGSEWGDLYFKEVPGGKISTDNLVQWVKDNHPEKKALLVTNVKEQGSEYTHEKISADDLIVFDTAIDNMMRITEEDYGNFARGWTDEMTDNEERYFEIVKRGGVGFIEWLDEYRQKYEEENGEMAAPVRVSMDIDYIGLGLKGTRRVSNKIANNSNLRHFIKKGIPVQMHPRLQAFIVATTKDFNKLPKKLRTDIEQGQMNIYTVINLLRDASSLNTFTFQAIAKYIYDNEEAAKLTFKEMQSTFDELDKLSAVSLMPHNTGQVMSIKEMEKFADDIYDEANKNPELEYQLEKVSRKIFGNVEKSVIDINKERTYLDQKVLNSTFLINFDGTLDSIRLINSIGKKITSHQEAQRIKSDKSDKSDTDNNIEDRQDKSEKTGETTKTTEYNWIDRGRWATKDYGQDMIEPDEVIEILGRDKIVDEVKTGIRNEILDRIQRSKTVFTKEQQIELQKEYNSRLAVIDALSDEDLVNRYYAVNNNYTEEDPNKRTIEDIIKPAEPSQKRTRKNIKDHMRNVGREITKRLFGSKTRFESLSPEVKAVLDPNTYKLMVSAYTNLSNVGLETLLEHMKKASKKLNMSVKKIEVERRSLVAERKRLEKMAQKQTEKKSKEKPKNTTEQTMREKTNLIHKTRIVNQTFTFDSREEITTTTKVLLNTQWGSTKISEVQGVSVNEEQNVHSSKLFFEQNGDILQAMTTEEAENTAKWFMSMAGPTNADIDSPASQSFAAIRLFLLGWIFDESNKGRRFDDMNQNMTNRIEKFMKKEVTVSGTLLSVWQKLLKRMNPEDAMYSADMELAGVPLTQDEKDKLRIASTTRDIPLIQTTIAGIIQRVNMTKSQKKNILRKITTVRSMSMLTNPLTWARNVISNEMLKKLNRFADKIGSKIAPSSKHVQGQMIFSEGNLKLDKNGKIIFTSGVITPDIQAYINKNFIDNDLFNTLVNNLSRYNPSDIMAKHRNAYGQATKESIFEQMVVKSLYNQFYNQNLFDKTRAGKALNWTHTKLMKAMSDNNYVREAAIRYFGKILAERKYELMKVDRNGAPVLDVNGNQIINDISDPVMNDFGTAVGRAMSDYMHSDNIFNKFETMLAESHESYLFLYKLVLPFAKAQWNWFKAAMTYSPAGLVQSLWKLSHIENEVKKAELAWAESINDRTGKRNKTKSQIDPIMTEMLIRRNVGAGIIGTTSLFFGMILAALGYVSLEDDDYGVPKLTVGNLEVDVSTLFGSSSVLAGMALVKTWQDNESTIKDSFDAALDPFLDGFFLTQILEMDRYTPEGWASLGSNLLEQTLLSFIPNGVRWLSGLTYTGKLKPTNFFEKAAAKIPFLNAALNFQTNPYTGKTGRAAWNSEWKDMWDAFNRVAPFLDVRTTSILEKDTKNYGINKEQLRGQYEINDEAFTLSTKDTADLNKQYGEWNAAALTLFYNNESKHSVKMQNGKFKTLTYNQMTEDERRRALQSIFSQNAEYAKIFAWLKAGNKYYINTEKYVELRRLGITGKLYKGTKGYVKEDVY